jgi:hypothetical protein
MTLPKLASVRERLSIFNPEADRHSSNDHCDHWRMLMETPEIEMPAAKRPVWNAGRSARLERFPIILVHTHKI